MWGLRRGVLHELKPPLSSIPQPAQRGPTRPWPGTTPAPCALPAATPRSLQPPFAPALRVSFGPVLTPHRPPALVSPPPTPGVETGQGVGWEEGDPKGNRWGCCDWR